MPPQEDPYAFITQAPPKQKKPFIPQPDSPKRKILLAAGLFGVLVFFGIVFLLIFSSGGANTEPLISIAQTQNEIIRISTIASPDIKSAATADFNQSTHTSTVSARKQTLDYIASLKGKAPPAKELALKQSSKTDEALKTANQSGNFDQVVDATLYNQLKAYQAEVAKVYESSGSAKTKALMKSLYDGITTLLKNQTAPTTRS